MMEFLGNTLYWFWFTALVVYIIAYNRSVFWAFVYFLFVGPLGSLLLLLFFSARKKAKRIPWRGPGSEE